jgi:hypothetical protein
VRCEREWSDWASRVRARTEQEERWLSIQSLFYSRLHATCTHTHEQEITACACGVMCARKRSLAIHDRVVRAHDVTEARRESARGRSRIRSLCREGRGWTSIPYLRYQLRRFLSRAIFFWSCMRP